MVQILEANPTKRPSFLDSLFGGMARGVEPAAESYFQNKAAQSKTALQNEALKKAGFGDLIGLPEKVQQAVITEKLKGQRKQEELSQLNEALGFTQGKTRSKSMADELVKGEPNEEESRFYTPEQKALIAQIKPAVERSLSHSEDVERREETAKRQMEQKENLERRKETLPLRKEYADKAKFAKQAIENKKGSLALLKTGKVDDPFVVEMTKFLPGAIGNKLLSPETNIYRAGLFDEFGVLRSMFPGSTRVKEIELLEDKLATLDKSQEAKEELLETGIIKSERDIILAKAARQVEKENPNATYLELEEEVQNRAQPELEKLFNRLMDKYEDIYIKHASPTTVYVDQFGKEYKVDDKSKLKKFLQQAKSKGKEIRVKSGT